MTLGLYDPERRYRQRARTRMLNRLVFLAFIGGIGAGSYYLGMQQSKGVIATLQDELETATTARETLEQRVVSLEAETASMEERYARLEERYEQDVPTGTLAEIARLAQQRIENGLDEERLRFVIANATEPRDCTSPETRRFIVNTPLQSGANTSVAFYDGTITVTGQGTTARDEAGNQEAWFDPAEPVTIQFTRLGGETTTAEGTLPIHHSVMMNGAEYRFTVAAGAQAFVEVTADRCQPFDENEDEDEDEGDE